MDVKNGSTFHSFYKKDAVISVEKKKTHNGIVNFKKGFRFVFFNQREKGSYPTRRNREGVKFGKCINVLLSKYSWEGGGMSLKYLFWCLL